MNSIISEATTKQPAITSHFMRVVKNHKLSHAYLFSGESGSGKLPLALTITMRLFCVNLQNGYPCGKCNECQRISNHQHPDVVIIEPQGQTIRVDQIRFLKSEFTKSAVEGNQKVFIIDDADRMTNGAANSLLKFIEEPADNVTSFLLTTNKSAILPTIISRTQVVELPSLSNKIFFNELKQIHVNPSEFNLISALTNKLSTVKEWEKDSWLEKLQKAISNWFIKINRKDYSAFPLVQTDIMPLVNKREGQEVTINMIIQLWCDVMNCKFQSRSIRDLKFPRLVKPIREMANRIQTNDLLLIIELMLSSNKLLTFNVKFQNILEMITLKTLARL